MAVTGAQPSRPWDLAHTLHAFSDTADHFTLLLPTHPVAPPVAPVQGRLALEQSWKRSACAEARPEVSAGTYRRRDRAGKWRELTCFGVAMRSGEQPKERWFSNHRGGFEGGIVGVGERASRTNASAAKAFVGAQSNGEAGPRMESVGGMMHLLAPPSAPPKQRPRFPADG